VATLVIVVLIAPGRHATSACSEPSRSSTRMPASPSSGQPPRLRHSLRRAPAVRSYAALIPQELRHLNEAQLDKALLRRGLGFVLDDPLRFAWLSVGRAREYFMFWPSPSPG